MNPLMILQYTSGSSVLLKKETEQVKFKALNVKNHTFSMFYFQYYSRRQNKSYRFPITYFIFLFVSQRIAK